MHTTPFIHITIAALVLITSTHADTINSMTYGTFVEHLRNGSVKEVTFESNDHIIATFGDTATNKFRIPFPTRPATDPLLREELNKAGITPASSGRTTLSAWFIPGVWIVVAIWYFIPLISFVLLILIYRRLKTYKTDTANNRAYR